MMTPPKPLPLARGSASSYGSALRCLAWAQRIHWPHENDSVLQEMVLNGTVRVRPMGSTVWWLDEELQQHWRALDGEALALRVFHAMSDKLDAQCGRALLSLARRAKQVLAEWR